ncbi:DMT family transporter [Rhizobiaceae bacterium n13]|uniref:DMT family transporter n=1 Tax=Ferirhizobium litorale TaxID=2927786 RepID=A0AAE3U410_9HYPH|nr:DMT family transporter [Fererhizobium litorale]MDI7862197.1 DMT family transporter [Fererhizobium litorale]MDI7922529.1 DMT family transporter [Fererhizobium litorale]
MTAPTIVMTGTSVGSERMGAALVFGSAFFWSFGGAIARYLDISDSWTIVFWRCIFAGLFLLTFMLLRDGPRGTVELFRNMGWPGMAVGLSFATASTSFIIAISYTTVANVVLIQAGVPLLAALMAWIFYRERVSLFTWAAIAAVILGVAIMVSGSLTGSVSPIGDALALLIATVFALTTVITRRYTNVRMTPAACLGAWMACTIAATQAASLSVTAGEMGLLVVFGALNLGLGMALFVTGARLIPSALAALLGTAETMLAPIWVAVIHGEVPNNRAITGGAIILAALLSYLWVQFRHQRMSATLAQS